MISAQELVRREAIAAYELLTRESEPDLENLVQLAASVCDVSTAVINIIDDRFQHQIAAVGLEAAVCSREDSMCAKVFEDPGHVVVADARADPRFASNPFVTGEIAWVRFYASSPIITPEGIPIGTLCVFDEEVGELTSEENRSLALIAHQIVDVLELRRATRELERSNSQLETFAAQVSHDLRNPLTALSGFLELAVDSPEAEGAPELREALGRAESAAERMRVMLAELYEYARVGGAQPSLVEFELRPVVTAVLGDLAAEIARTSAEVVVDAELRIRGDATLLGVLVQNLVANALKFAAGSGIAPYVEVRAERIEGGITLTVDDNGPGIPEEHREQVFELLQRGEPGHVPGLGIGLATCRRITEGLGGRIGVDVSPLGGARVWAVFPQSD